MQDKLYLSPASSSKEKIENDNWNMISKKNSKMKKLPILCEKNFLQSLSFKKNIFSNIKHG